MTLTDYHGYHQLVQIHDPPLIHERDHHHVLQFTYRRRPNGEVESDFDLDNAPALAFAARATSSFPGAFPPARIVEIDEVVALTPAALAAPLGLHRESLSAPHAGRPRPDHGCLHRWRGAQQPAVPGGDLGDPRPARLSPGRSPAGLHRAASGAAEDAPARHGCPGFFATLRGAMTDIPRVAAGDRRTQLGHRLQRPGAPPARHHRQRASADQPAGRERHHRRISIGRSRPNELRAWREQVNTQVTRDAGFAYQAYVRLKLASVRAFGAELIVKLRGAPAQSPLSRVVAEIIDAWALHKGIVYERADSAALEFEAQTAGQLPGWVKYLLAFDVKYRERRLHFMIEGQNRLYALLDQERFAGLDPLVVDRPQARVLRPPRCAAAACAIPASTATDAQQARGRDISSRAVGRRGQEPARLRPLIRRTSLRQDSTG